MDLAFLTGLVTAVVELVKAAFKAFDVLADDAQREVVVRIIAGVVGIVVALAFQYDPLHAVPTLAGMVATGLALGITSDLLHVGIDLGKSKAAELQSRADAPATSGTMSMTASVEAAPSIVVSKDGVLKP
jgi:hypothetical protein